MDWTDDAIVLSVRGYGDTGAILEALTRDHGRHLGLVHGGASRKTRATLQPGNTLRLHWRARLSEHLGSFSVEPSRTRAGTLMEYRGSLIGLNAFISMATALLPEREPHPGLFEVAEIFLDALMAQDTAHWLALYIRWEMGVLDALGFGLDLSRCAGTGMVDNLIYVSPRSGRAVSREAGRHYTERLFPLPAFLLGPQNISPSRGDILDGLKLTERFLQQRVLAPNEREIPAARLRLNELAAGESDKQSA